MKKYYSTMKTKITGLFVCFILATFTSFSQIVQTESFDANQFLPTGWSAVGTAPNWARVTTLNTPLTGGPHSGAGMARMRFPNNGTGTSSTESISTPVFDLTARGTDTVKVSFWIFRDSLAVANQDSLTVYVNTTNTLTGASKIGAVARNRSINLPNTKAVNGWYQYAFEIPASFNGASNYIIFSGTCFGPSASARRIFIDDVSWKEYPPLCSGTPTAGTLSATTTTFCGGSGNTTMALNNATTGNGITYQWFTSSTATGPFVPLSYSDTTGMTGTLNANQYYYVAVGCSGSNLSANSNTLMITVSNTPLPIVSIGFNNDTICRNDTLSLTASGAITYQWSTQNNPNLGTTSSLDALPQNTTTYTLVGYDATGCASAPMTQTIVVGRKPTIIAVNNSNPSICVGGNSLISVQAISGVGGGGGNVTLSYLWNPTNATTANVTVSPQVSTTYTVTVIGQFGCFSMDSTVVDVNTMAVSPTVSVSPATTQICQGATTAPIDLIASASSNVSYSWAASAGPPLTATDSVLTISTFGNQTITYIVTVTDNANGCASSASGIIYIRPTPNVNAVSPATTVCLNGSSVLSAQVTNTFGTSVNYYTFAWTPGNATTQLNTISPTASGYYYVTVTSPYGCSNMDSIFIQYDPTLTGPTVSINPAATIMCANNLSPVQLIATTNETNPTFQWTPNNVSQNNDSILVNPTNTTNYSVSVTAANGCVSAAGASVVVGQLPVPNFTTVSAAGNTVIFNNTTANGVAYLWNFGDGTSSTAMNPTHIYATSGQWTVTLEVTNAQGCASTSSSIVNSSVLSVNEIAASNFVVYPNPVASSFTIESDKALNSEITIISITGKIVKKAHLTNGQATINIQELQRGSYFVQIQENNTIQTKLVIKE